MDEDDGQIARELVPVDEAFMKKDDEEGKGATLGLEQKCNTVSKLAHVLVEGPHVEAFSLSIYLSAAGETCRCRQEQRGTHVLA